MKRFLTAALLATSINALAIDIPEQCFPTDAQMSNLHYGGMICDDGGFNYGGGKFFTHNDDESTLQVFELRSKGEMIMRGCVFDNQENFYKLKNLRCGGRFNIYEDLKPAMFGLAQKIRFQAEGLIDAASLDNIVLQMLRDNSEAATNSTGDYIVHPADFGEIRHSIKRAYKASVLSVIRNVDPDSFDTPADYDQFVNQIMDSLETQVYKIIDPKVSERQGDSYAYTACTRDKLIFDPIAGNPLPGFSSDLKRKPVGSGRLAYVIERDFNDVHHPDYEDDQYILWMDNGEDIHGNFCLR